MSRLSCTNQRYEQAPLQVEIIDVVLPGTLLYTSSDKASILGMPHPFTLQPPSQRNYDTYIVEKDIPYVEGLPESGSLQGLCWSCNPDEEVECFDDNLNSIPHPCAWWQWPYLYLCNLDNLTVL